MVMKNIGRIVTKFPAITIAVVIAITISSVLCISHYGLSQEFEEEAFLPDIEIAKASQEISEQYTSTYSVSILVKSKHENLLTSNALVEILQLEKDITNDSIIRLKLETPEMPSANVISVADIIAQVAFSQQNVTFPTFEQKIHAIQAMDDGEIKWLISSFLTSNYTSPMIKGMFLMMLTKDFNLSEGKIGAKGTMVRISLNESIRNEEEESLELENDINGVVQSQDLMATEMTTIGERIINSEIMEANNKSMGILLPLALGLVIVILAIIYRNAFDMIISLLALVFAVIWIYGFGAAMGYTFNPMTIAVPVLIVGLGIDYGIHVTMRYREEIRKKEDVKGSISMTIKSVGMALLLATITTVLAFLSNLASPIGLLSDFGVLCAVGIIGSFVTMTTFVPACKQIRDERKLKKGKSLIKKQNPKERRKMRGTGVTLLDKTMASGAIAAEHHPKAVVAIVVIVTIAMVGGALQLSTEFAMEDFLPKELDITKNIKFMTEEFEVAGGEAEEVSILVKGDISNPEILRGIDQTIDNMKDDEWVIKIEDNVDVESILSLMEDYATFTPGVQDTRFNQTFSIMYSNVMDDGIPRENATSTQIKSLYDWLYTNAEKDVKYVLHRSNSSYSSDYDGAVLRISVNTGEKEDKIWTLYDDLKDDKLPLESSAVTIVTGRLILMNVIMDALKDSQTRSMIITLIVSFIILSIIFWFGKRSFILGGITLLPVTLCIAWTLGTMYLVGIPLNVMTITIASLTIGLGVTYGIHITHRFLEDIERHDSIDEACRSTVSHTGTALFGAAATTIAGFGLLVFALMPPLQQFGAIAALAILYSFLASVFILPTFLVMWAKWKKRSNG